MNKPAKKPQGGAAKVFARNKKARFDYQVVETLECGLVLEGWEVKSIRAGKASIAGSYIKFLRGAPVLIGSRITPLDTADRKIEPDPERKRPLLMKKRDMRDLSRSVREGGLSCVPLELRLGRSSYIKLAVALARGRKRADKRALIKERESKRSQAKALKEGRRSDGGT